MLSQRVIKVLQYFPDSVVKHISRKVINMYLDKYADIKVEGYENLIGVKRPIIFICNHLSNSDSLVLNRVLAKEDVTFVSGIKIYNNKTTNIGTYTLKTTPIKPNSPDKSGLMNIVNLLKSGVNILIFPEGTRSRTCSMNAGKKGVLLIQKLTGASVIPIGLCGTEKLLPINTNDMAEEKFQYANINVKVGKSVEISSKNKNETKGEYETRILNILMCNIASLLPKEYRGVYDVLVNN